MLETPFTEARNFVYTYAGTINCEVLHKEYGWIPFHATPYDDVEYGRQLFSVIKEMEASGEITVAPHIPPEEEELAFDIRVERNIRLRDSDWTQLCDTPDKIKLAWQEYRTRLRDITLQKDFPFSVEWPEEPTL